jgi:DNA-binding NarL/FixJ family response regulator
LVDDHPLVRAGVRVALKECSGLVVIGEAADGRSALTACREQRPDVVVLDMCMPGLNGMAALKELSRELPSLKSVAFSMSQEPWLVQEALRAGAKGYVFKSSSPEQLREAVTRVIAGEVYIDPALPQASAGNAHVANSATALSKRELQVLRLAVQGVPAKEAAQELELSPRTLETYKARAMQKLQLRSRADLMRFATFSGWLHADG